MASQTFRLAEHLLFFVRPRQISKNKKSILLNVCHDKVKCSIHIIHKIELFPVIAVF